MVYTELEKQSTASLLDHLLYQDDVIQEQALMLLIKRINSGTPFQLTNRIVMLLCRWSFD